MGGEREGGDRQGGAQGQAEVSTVLVRSVTELRTMLGEVCGGELLNPSRLAALRRVSLPLDYNSQR